MRLLLRNLICSMGYAELYKAIAAMIRRFDFELHQTTADDVHTVLDAFVPAVKKGSKGIRVLVH